MWMIRRCEGGAACGRDVALCDFNGLAGTSKGLLWVGRGEPCLTLKLNLIAER